MVAGPRRRGRAGWKAGERESRCARSRRRTKVVAAGGPSSGVAGVVELSVSQACDARREYPLHRSCLQPASRHSSGASLLVLSSVSSPCGGRILRHVVQHGFERLPSRHRRTSSRFLQLRPPCPCAAWDGEGHSRRALLDHHLHHHHPADMDLHPGLDELNRHHERDYAVSSTEHATPPRLTQR